jgi:hypothetical protein
VRLRARIHRIAFVKWILIHQKGNADLEGAPFSLSQVRRNFHSELPLLPISPSNDALPQVRSHAYLGKNPLGTHGFFRTGSAYSARVPCAGCATSLSGGRRDSEAEFSRLFPEQLDLLLTVSLFVVQGASVNVALTVLQHSIDQAGESVGHRSDGFGGTQRSTQTAILSSEVGAAAHQDIGGHSQGCGGTVDDMPRAFAQNFVAADTVSDPFDLRPLKWARLGVAAEPAANFHHSSLLRSRGCGLLVSSSRLQSRSSQLSGGRR